MTDHARFFAPEGLQASRRSGSGARSSGLKALLREHRRHAPIFSGRETDKIQRGDYHSNSLKYTGEMFWS